MDKERLEGTKDEEESDRETEGGGEEGARRVRKRLKDGNKSC